MREPETAGRTRDAGAELAAHCHVGRVEPPELAEVTEYSRTVCDNWLTDNGLPRTEIQP